ncbi:MAG: hypothetical protein QM497_03890 [Sulfurimonas sp.]
MKELIEEHIKKFGVEPNIIGMFWNNQDAIINGIIEALDEKTDKPYDEYKMLSKKDRKAFDAGGLLF